MNVSPGYDRLRVRITKLPDEQDLQSSGFDLTRFEVGKSYDIGSTLADYLVISGFGRLEPIRPRPRREFKLVPPLPPRD